MGDTRIEWTDATWNPVTGCDAVSAGCRNCYAKRMAQRMRGRCGYPADEPFRVTVHRDKFGEPLQWRKPRRIFVCSMGDLFHNSVSDEAIHDALAVMALSPQHTFQVLTKRPERASRVLSDAAHATDGIANAMILFCGSPAQTHDEALRFPMALRARRAELYRQWYRREGWPLGNLWLGVTVENQANEDRIRYLLQIPAAVRFVSVEPMIEAVNLRIVAGPEGDRLGESLVALGGPEWPTGIDWVICGGETGPGARECRREWVESLSDQCAAARVPFFSKRFQWEATGALARREWPKQGGA